MCLPLWIAAWALLLHGTAGGGLGTGVGQHIWDPQEPDTESVGCPSHSSEGSRGGSTPG